MVTWHDGEERMKWFHRCRFGMFIHWGLYSIPARGEWVMLAERIPLKEYARLADRFRPKKFDPDAWVQLARDAGMKYMVLTTRHHDGFCLYDSKVSDYTSVKTGAKRDFVAEYVRACRRGGMKVGLYYSLLDWRFPAYWAGPKKDPRSFAEMVEQAHAQVRELMTRYGKIDHLFFDGAWLPGIPTWPGAARHWKARKLVAMIRKLQPHIVINNRTGLPADYDTPEQVVRASRPGRAWESCMTIGDSCGWGYIRHNPNMKTATQLIQHLVNAAAGEGNFLLNIGPKPDGTIRREEVQRLRQVGAWMKLHGKSIYGSERCTFGSGFAVGIILPSGITGTATAKGNTAFIHFFRWPGVEACIPDVANEVKSARILTTGQEVRTKRTPDGRLFLQGLPKTPPDPYDTVIELKLDGPPQAIKTNAGRRMLT